MRKLIGTAAALAMLAAAALYAQDIAGSWQGTLKAGRDLRLIVEITKGEHGAWNAMCYSIDQSSDGIRASSVTLEGSTVKLAVDAIGVTYEGTLSADGNSIKGTWTKETAWKRDASPHTIQFVAVDKDMKLEVLDWGGSGRPLVFLAGLGNTAHIFDDFAPKLAGQYHVYGITRRGFGASSTPAPIAVNYTADRLGDDVLGVCTALKLERPVLAGHSIAGEELSSVGSRHPERVAGLIYLDAGYGYAFYDVAHGDLEIDSLEVQKKLDVLSVVGPGDEKVLVKELLEASLPRLEKDLREEQKDLEAAHSQAPPSSRPSAPSPATAIIAGEQKYTGFRGVPVLAIFALPHEAPPNLKNTRAEAKALEARELETGGALVKAFEVGIESAHVVVLPHANHYVFRSNETDVLREMNAFLAGLK